MPIRHMVAVAPRSPIGYNEPRVAYSLKGVAVAPRSPIGYNIRRARVCGFLVAVAPRSPIGYNHAQRRGLAYIVAVAPRSPIGYNRYRIVQEGVRYASCRRKRRKTGDLDADFMLDKPVFTRKAFVLRWL